MRTPLARFALAGALGLTGVAGAALAVPAVASAATGGSTAVADRVTAITEALAGLVSDGTITQSQADSVATALADSPALRGPGGPGGPRGVGRELVEVAEDLGITAEELRAAAEAGTTLGALADEQGVDRDALVDAVVEAARERLAQAVTDGRLTQAEADERAAAVEERVTAALEQPVRAGRGGRGHHGPDGPRGEAPPEAGTDS